MVCAGVDPDLDETCSVATAGGSDDQRESSDSASFSIPSLELSDGLTAAGNSLDLEEGLSPSLGAVGPEASSLSTKDPGQTEQEPLGAAGETSAAPEQADCHLSVCKRLSEQTSACSSAPHHVVVPSTGGAVAAAAPPAESGPSMPAYYLVKWITWKEKKTPIITQSENGPCPLLAIMNTLFLRWKVEHSVRAS